MAARPKFENNPKDRRYEFFPTQRRKLILEGITAQCNKKGDDRKIVFHGMMPLTGQPLVGFPGFLQPAWEAAEKEASIVSEAKMKDFTLDGIDIEFFSLSDSKRALIKSENKTLYDFTIEREPDGDSYITVLRFKFRQKETKKAYCFWVDHGHNEIWAEFTPSANALKESDDQQMTLSESGGEVERDDVPTQTAERRRAVEEEEEEEAATVQ